MMELRGRNGLLEGSCVETCGMPSSHAASCSVAWVSQALSSSSNTAKSHHHHHHHDYDNNNNHHHRDHHYHHVHDDHHDS